MTKKYRGKTILSIAHGRGSKAQTKAGAWKYLLATLPKPTRTRNSSKYDWDQWRDERRNRTGDGRARVLGYDIDDPNTPGRIREEAWEMNRLWDQRRCCIPYRTAYGAIITRYNSINPMPRPDDKYFAAQELISAAEGAGKILREYDDIERDRKGRFDGDAVHHEIYDYDATSAIVCVRETEGSRYGVKTLSKTYYLITRRGRGYQAKKLTIPVAKYAKMGILHFGDIIAVAKGRKKIKLLNATNQVHRGYKAVRIGDDGTYRSVWDDSLWQLNEPRTEKAQDNHQGGLYYYRNFRAMIDAAQQNAIFGDDRQHHRLAVLEVKATGSHIQYGDKFAATRITPIRHFASII